MNYTVIKLGPAEVQKFQECQRIQEHYSPAPILKTDAFKILPPLSSKIPAPAPAPNLHRLLPPLPKKRPSFVIVQEVGSRPSSRDPSPGRENSFLRGCGFKPSSRETSPARQKAETEKDKNVHRSRSRLPIVSKSPRKISKSVSPNKIPSNIPRPLNHQKSYSPNRTKNILSEINSKILDRPLKNSKKFPLNGKLTNGELYKSTPDLQQIKPPLPKTPIYKKNEQVSSPSTIIKTGNHAQKSGSKSPSKVTNVTNIVKTEPTKKSNPNLASPKKLLSPRTPVKSRNISRSPDKTVKIQPNTLKENLKPSKVPLKSPKKLIKSQPVFKKPESKPPSQMGSRNSSSTNINQMAMKSAVENKPKENTEISEEVNSSSNTKTINKRAQTSSNLFNELKTTKKQSADKNSTVDSRVNSIEDKKELSHTDTSISLPIMIRNADLTESSATLIRTTTEPVLAPIQPNLIEEMRNVMTDGKINEIVCIKQEKNDTNCEPVSSNTADIINEPQLSDATQPVPEPKQLVKIIEKNEPKLNSVIIIEKSTNPESKNEVATSDNNSSQPEHVNVIAKIDEPTQEISSNKEKIKQAPTLETLNGNNLLQNEKRNGSTKSIWLKSNPESSVMKTSTSHIPSNENLSTEKLLHKPKTQWSCLENYAPCCFRKSESSKNNSISVITNGDMKLPQSESCIQHYCCCFCHKCKIKKNFSDGSKISERKWLQKCQCRCCGGCFHNVFDRIICGKRKSEDLEDGRVDPPVPGRFVKCKNAFLKSFSILCCWNTAICLKFRKKCQKLCSCCKSSCCNRKSPVINEQDRRPSVPARKPRWTRIFTDFPKLDVSFVEHASIMRGAIPVLPVPLAFICLILNVFLPGTGTLTSGIFCLFVGKPRFSINDSIKSRIGSFLVNLLVAGSQLFTVLFCLVGWGWSIWWGVIMYKMAKKNRRIMMAEQAGSTPHSAPVLDQNHEVERGITR